MTLIPNDEQLVALDAEVVTKFLPTLAWQARADRNGEHNPVTMRSFVWARAGHLRAGQNHLLLWRVQNLQGAGPSPEVPSQERLGDSSLKSRCLSTPPITPAYTRLAIVTLVVLGLCMTPGRQGPF